MKFSEKEYDYLLPKIPYRSMLEEVLLHFNADDYLLTAEQISHFLKLDVAIEILNGLLGEVEADISNDGLMQSLLTKGVSEKSLITQLKYPKATCLYSNRTLQLAIEKDYSDELIGMIIRMARSTNARLYTDTLGLDSSSSHDEYFGMVIDECF
jgi:protein-arginine kinase